MYGSRGSALVMLMDAPEISGPRKHHRCTLCEERIGVYEPIVYVSEDSVRHTSLAAEPSLQSEAHENALFHRACYGTAACAVTAAPGRSGIYRS